MTRTLKHRGGFAAKRGLAIGAMLTTAALALAGCSAAAEADSATEIKVIIADYSDATAPYWNSFKEKYEAQTGVTLNLQIIGWNDIDQQTSTMIQTGNIPDILNINAYASYAADGLLYSADEVLSPEVAADILPTFVRNGTVDGEFYGMPDLSSVRAMFYNVDLFEQAGVEAPPTTWDEFVEAAKKITALGDGIVGYAQPLGAEDAQSELAMWLFNNGGDFKTDGEWTLNSPQNVETLEFMKSLSVTHGVTQNNPGSTNRTDGAFALFQAGKAGMVLGFSPLQSSLDADYPDVNYALAPMPSGNGAEPQTFGVTDYLMSFKKDGNQEAIRAFYELYYSPDEINTWIKAENFLPVTISGLEVFSSDPSLAVYLETLPNTHLTPGSDPAWDRIRLTIQQNIGTAVAPDGDPKKWLDDLQAQAEAAG
jgi:multiple sugar transport system substrate-binding protein